MDKGETLLENVYANRYGTIYLPDKIFDVFNEIRP